MSSLGRLAPTIAGLYLLCALSVAVAHGQICGDADGSGTMTVTDGVAVLRAAAGLESPCAERRCDVDGNGTVSVSDGVATLQRAAQLPSAASCGTRFGALVKTVRVNGVVANLRIGPPPAPDPNAPIDVVTINGPPEVPSGEEATFNVGLQRAVDSLLIGVREGSGFVDGFSEVQLNGNTTAVDVTLDVAEAANATVDLGFGSIIGEQVGGFQTRSLSIVTPPSRSTIACDEIVQERIEATIDTDRFAFDVGEGSHIEVSLSPVAPVTAGFDPVWRLLDGTGAARCQFCVSGFVGCNFTVHGAGLSGCGPLSADGNPYRIEVADGGSDSTGEYRLHLQYLDAATACESRPVPADAIVDDAIDQALDTDLLAFGFTASEGEVVSVNVVPRAPVDPNFQTIWRLVDGSGADTCKFCVSGFVGCNFVFHSGAADCGPLSALGNPYRVEVLDSASDAAGAYSVLLQR